MTTSVAGTEFRAFEDEDDQEGFPYYVFSAQIVTQGLFRVTADMIPAAADLQAGELSWRPAAEGGGVVIEPGLQEIQATLTVTFAIS